MSNIKFDGSAIKMVRRFSSNSILTEHLIEELYPNGLYLVDIGLLSVARVTRIESSGLFILEQLLTLLEDERETNTHNAVKFLLQLSLNDYEVNKDCSTFLAFFVRELNCSFTFSFNSWSALYD